MGLAGFSEGDPAWHRSHLNNSIGKDLRVLHEGAMEPGDFQYEWDTTELAVGTYYVTLLLNGETVVQKVVKVSR